MEKTKPIQMIYQKRQKGQLLYQATYRGIHYYIISFGSHPCAYVDVTDTPLNKQNYTDIDFVRCHGGLTYSEDYLLDIINNRWIIGWDYAHYGDYIYMAGFERNEVDKEWTVEEIIQDCNNVINQIINNYGDTHSIVETSQIYINGDTKINE